MLLSQQPCSNIVESPPSRETFVIAEKKDKIPIIAHGFKMNKALMDELFGFLHTFWICTKAVYLNVTTQNVKLDISSTSDSPPYTWPLTIFLGSVLVTSFSNLTFPRLWAQALSLSHILSQLPFSLDFIDQPDACKANLYFFSYSLSFTEGIMTSFVRQINCIHPFSSQSMLPVYFFSSKHILCRAFSSSFLSS